MTETEHKSPQTHIRWICSNCDFETARSRPGSHHELENEEKSESCPQCGKSSPYAPYPAIHDVIQMQRVNGVLPEGDDTTVTGESVEDALNGYEIGPEMARRDPSIHDSEAPSECHCDWCGDMIHEGDSVTAYAFERATPPDEPRDGWGLHEVYCENCDVSELLLGGVATDDVVVHGFIERWGDMYTLEDTVVIDRKDMGEDVDFTKGRESQ